mmetsp:Transcript_26789/g.39632  ORF Transcript_26789/g.39632 Transcript_26789/m.39632 type:complete len:114 (-) Transcript_26789:155-496(-)
MALAPLLSSFAFGFTFYKVNPTQIVDRLIKFAVDAIVPGRGMGEQNWFMQNWRAVEQSAEKSSREFDIRADLRRWDEQFPELHHELIVRIFAGFLASSVVTAIYDTFRPHPRR